MKVLLAPVVSEKSTFVGEKSNQYVFRVAVRRDQARDQGCGRAHVQDPGEIGQRRQRQGQGEALRPLHGPPQQLEEGLRRARRGPGNQLRRRGEPSNASSKSNPPLPAGAQLVKVVTPELHKGKPVASLVESESKKRGPQQPRPHHHAAQGRRPQAALPPRRLQAQQGRHRRESRAHRIRSEPQRAPRAAALRRRRAPLRDRAEGRRRSARSSCPARKRRSRSGNTLPLRNIPVGTTICCVEMMPGKGAQIARAAGTSVQLLAREGEYAQLRLRSGEIRKRAHQLPRDHRRSRQRGAHPGIDRQGRARALARRAPDGARRGDEPDRPPARRRRRPDRRGAASGEPVGRAHQGLQDAQEQAHATA